MSRALVELARREYAAKRFTGRYRVARTEWTGVFNVCMRRVAREG